MPLETSCSGGVAIDSLCEMQAFISHLMRKLQEVGLQTPDPQQLPAIIYHDGRSSFPGETMESAAKAGYQKFRVAPQIIFVLLPDNCEFS